MGMLNWSLTVWKVCPRVMHSAALRSSSSDRLMRRFVADPTNKINNFIPSPQWGYAATVPGLPSY